METTPIFEKLKSDMNKTIEHTLNEFNNLHTGKASPAMLDAVKVNAYGSTMSLKECAAVTTPDAKTIVVQPWDFQDAKADVRMRYTKTQSIYLSRKGVLPEIVDLFGMTEDQFNQDDDRDSKIDSTPAAEPTSEAESVDEAEDGEDEVEDKPTAVWADDDDDIDSFFG